MTKTTCSECDGRRDEHEVNCAFSTYDGRDYVAPRESRWVATFASGREILFGLGSAADEAFAREYAEGRLTATWNAFADGDVLAVRREG